VPKAGRLITWYLRRSGVLRRAGKALRRVLRARQRVLARLPAREPAPRSVERYVADCREQLAARRVAVAHRLAEHGLRQHPDAAELFDVRASTLDYLGRHDRALDACLSGARLHAARLAEAAKPARPLTPDQRIFLSGYFYSGSGAVLDWLRGFRGTTKWSPAGEMRLIKFPGGMADLTDRLGRQGRLGTADLVEHYLHLVGGKVTLLPPGVYNQWEMVNRDARHLFGHARTAGYLHACLQTFLDLARTEGRVSAETLDDLFRDGVRRALDAAAGDTGAESLLVDQAVTAWRLPIARLAPPSTFVVVHRDPRDQFVEAREVSRQPGRARTTLESFVATYREHRELVDRVIPELERDHGHRFVRLAFEDFVLDHAGQAERLRTELRLHGRTQHATRFVPEQSRANVGKYATRLSPTETAAIATALPEYLHDLRDHELRSGAGATSHNA
jgi:hypothetical protein